MPAKDVVSTRIPEWMLQAAICADLDRRVDEGEPFLFAGSLEGVKLNPYVAKMAKATGMKAGEPDLRLNFDRARIVYIELKAEDGKLGKDQKDRVPVLRGLGFVVHVVFATDEADAVAKIGAIVAMELAGEDSGALPSASYFPKTRK